MACVMHERIVRQIAAARNAAAMAPTSGSTNALTTAPTSPVTQAVMARTVVTAIVRSDVDKSCSLARKASDLAHWRTLGPHTSY